MIPGVGLAGVQDSEQKGKLLPFPEILDRRSLE